MCRYLDSLKIEDRKKCNLPEKSDQWNGIYRVVKGAFRINTEWRPIDDVNVYTDFYDQEDVDIKEVSTAYMTKRDLIVETKFLQTCFWTKLVFIM